MPQQPSYRNRFRAAYAFLGLVAVASAVGVWRVSEAVSAPRCTPLQGAQDPIATAISFIENAVERKNPGAAYGLVIPPLHRGLSCSQWAHAVPVAAFRPVDWSRASYRMTAGGTGQLVFDVKLAPRTHFLLELRQDGTRWLVGFWDRTHLPGPAPSGL